MNEFKSDLRNRMYHLVEEVVKIVHIGESLYDNKDPIPSRIEAEAYMSAYNFAVEARALFKFYNQIFPGERDIIEHYNLIIQSLEGNTKYIVNRIAASNK